MRQNEWGGGITFNHLSFSRHNFRQGDESYLMTQREFIYKSFNDNKCCQELQTKIPESDLNEVFDK